MDDLTQRPIEDFVRRVGADAERLLERLVSNTEERSSWAAFQQPGDIVLTRGVRPLSHLNAVLQSVLEGGIARATHSMMVAAPGLYVDASMRHGVTLMPAQSFCIDGAVRRQRTAATSEAASKSAKPVWRRRLVAVFRHPAFDGTPERQAALRKAIADQLGQPYNMRFAFKRVPNPELDQSAFCSELVARTFARLGLPIVPQRRFAAVFPHTLLRHLERQGWQDVSSDYRSGLQQAASA